MKPKIFIALFVLVANNVLSQNYGISPKDNWAQGWTNYKPQATEYNEPSIILTGNISTNQTLLRRNTYLLVGNVYLTNNAVLTIEAGTVIRGDVDNCGTLIVTKGAKLMALGTESSPIVFTSNKDVGQRKPGDWGGIALLGNAPVSNVGGMAMMDFNWEPALSVYGGNDVESSSGTLQFVRIEYAGKKINQTKEINALSLAGVGRKTKLENIQVSYSNDDSFEFFGGNVDCKNLISYRATDDDYDFTQGAQVKLDNIVAYRHPFSSDISGSRCIEIDSFFGNKNADFSRKQTNVCVSNATFLNAEDNAQGLVKEAIFVHDKTDFKITNSVVAGFSAFAILSEVIDYNPQELSKIQIQNNLSNNCKAFVSTPFGEKTFLDTWYQASSNGNLIQKLPLESIFVDIVSKKNMDFRLKNDEVIVIK